MKDYFVIWTIIGLLFIILFFIPKYNRNKNVWLRSGITFLAIMSFSAFASYFYKSNSSLFGYAFQHNQGLLGGYICVAFTLFLSIFWYIYITCYNKKYYK